MLVIFTGKSRKVRGSIKNKLNFWKEGLKANKFVLDTISKGYSLPFESFPPKYHVVKNNASSLRHREFVTQAILDLVEGDFIKEVFVPPHCVNPLTVAENQNKLRLVLDLGFVNEFLRIPKFRYEDLRDVVSFLEKDDYFIKFDVKSGYHHIEILEEHTRYLGFAWDFGNRRRYFVFEVLPFGLASACHCFSKVMRVFVKTWRGLGFNVLIYIDDGLSSSDSRNECRKAGSIIRRDLEEAGIVLNFEKSIWTPVQVGKFLGFIVDTTKMELRVPEEKTTTLLAKIEEVLVKGVCDAKSISRIAGRVISMTPALGPIARLFTRYMYNFIHISNSWYTSSPITDEVETELRFWKRNLPTTNGYKMRKNTTTTKVIFSDASEHGYGGYVMTKLGEQIAKGNFSAKERVGSSTLRELLAVKYVLQSFGNLLENENLLWFTDNQNIPKIIEVGSGKLHLTEVALEIFSLILKLNIEIRPVWIPREDNTIADGISKFKDSDSWGVDEETFDFVQGCFGEFTFDRFADHENHRVSRFSSRYFCPGAEDIDAFTADWARHFNYICPPVSLIGRAIRHCKMCGAEGVLICPEWKSAYFWPLLVEKRGKTFRSFVKDYRVLDPHFITFNESARSNVFCGFARFRTLALRISFK